MLICDLFGTTAFFIISFALHLLFNEIVFFMNTFMWAVKDSFFTRCIFGGFRKFFDIFPHVQRNSRKKHFHLRCTCELSVRPHQKLNQSLTILCTFEAFSKPKLWVFAFKWHSRLFFVMFNNRSLCMHALIAVLSLWKFSLQLKRF